MKLLDLYAVIQRVCFPGIWSKGVSLSREGSVFLDQKSSNEFLLRVRPTSQPVCVKVTLWPQDEDWYCDCEFKQEVCAHVAAAIIFLKNHPESQSESEGKKQIPLPQSKSARVVYRFTRRAGRLYLDRWIVQSDGREEILLQSLVGFFGGISSGRISSFPLTATRDDYAVDSALQNSSHGVLEPRVLVPLFKALAGCSEIQLEGQRVGVSSKLYSVKVRIVDEKSGVRLQAMDDVSVTERFLNGAVLCGNVLRAVEVSALSFTEIPWLQGDGRYFSVEELPNLVTQVIPALEKKISIDNQSKNLPKVIWQAPQIVLELTALDQGQRLEVLPKIVYFQGKSGHREILVEDKVAEGLLQRKLQSELQLNPGQKVEFRGDSAVEFVSHLKGWQVQGDGLASFSLNEALKPKIHFYENSFQIEFSSGNSNRSVSAQKVIQAWRENQEFVSLLGGGWAPLPQDWLARYGDRILALVNAQDSEGKIAACNLPELASFCEELGISYPNPLRKLQESLEQVETIEDVELPKDLSADLRGYQKTGVNWLCFLKRSQVGALLADDMGLGKTLQVLCAIQGQALIIVPTSVLYSWVQQIEQFRPSLTYCVYHGQERRLNLKADIILTTYALLRRDRSQIVDRHWDMVVLDEAQMIKNPKSQIARTAHALQGDFRVALSGTPVENQLTDLWSQFQFLNPGFLGSLEEFQDQFISRGNENTMKRLRKKVSPFILRRMKGDVAPELPPRTDTVLTCELTSEEREIYNALLASSRKEVIEKLEMGGGVFAALELLLRLRQACCHASLVPGYQVVNSSKIELLLESLTKAIAMGHRALVFSQWTSYLDLIEPALKSEQISFLRLDGHTRNRQEVVDQYQKNSAAAVMLISLKSGGVGLNLTAADHIYLMDPWWNPAVENQAADRAHRIGQRNPVFVYRLVAQDTLEERVLSLQKAKAQIAAGILEGTELFTSMTKEDILTLIS